MSLRRSLEKRKIIMVASDFYKQAGPPDVESSYGFYSMLKYWAIFGSRAGRHDLHLL